MELKTVPLKSAPAIGRETLSWHRCPECGSRMIKADTSIENGLHFVWFDCSKDGCGGSWLEKQKVT